VIPSQEAMSSLTPLAEKKQEKKLKNPWWFLMKSKNKNQSKIVRNRHFQIFKNGSKKGKNLKKKWGRRRRNGGREKKNDAKLMNHNWKLELNLRILITMEKNSQKFKHCSLITITRHSYSHNHLFVYSSGFLINDHK
jgi:hypothetical protein